MNRKQSVMPPKFRTRLGELRAQKDFTRRDLMRVTDISYQALVTLENKGVSRVEAGIVSQLCKVFDCKVDELIYLVDED